MKIYAWYVVNEPPGWGLRAMCAKDYGDQIMLKIQKSNNKLVLIPQYHDPKSFLATPTCKLMRGVNYERI